MARRKIIDCVSAEFNKRGELIITETATVQGKQVVTVVKAKDYFGHLEKRYNR